LGAAREAAAAGRADDLARAALALGGGLAGFEVPLQDEEQADLLRRADAALPPGETALRAAVRGRLSLALAGSAPEADRVALAHAAAAEAIGRRADSFNALLMAFTARMQAHLDRGTAAEYADDVSTLMAAAGPDIPGMYYAAPARLLLAAGDASQARAVLRAL